MPLGAAVNKSARIWGLQAQQQGRRIVDTGIKPNTRMRVGRVCPAGTLSEAGRHALPPMGVAVNLWIAEHPNRVAFCNHLRRPADQRHYLFIVIFEPRQGLVVVETPPENKYSAGSMRAP